MNFQESNGNGQSLILNFISENPQGASIREISLALGMNRNLVAKNLSILHLQGRIDLKTHGNVKLFRLTRRIPFHALSLITQGCVIGIDQLLYIKDVLGNCHAMTGSEIREILHKPFSNIFHPAFTDQEVQAYIMEYPTGAVAPPFHKEIFWRNTGFNLSIIPCIYDDGNPGLALLLCENPHYNQVQKKHADTIRTYQYLTQETPGFILHISLSGEVLYLNEEYTRYCGKTASDLLHTNGIPLVTREDFNQFIREAKKSPGESNTITYEFQVVKTDGTIRWQTWDFYQIREKGVLIELHGYGRDSTWEHEAHNLYLQHQTRFNKESHTCSSELQAITKKLREEIDERRTMEQILKRSEEKYRNLTEITTDIIWETDALGTLVYVNYQVYTILGYIPDELIGEKIWYIMHPDQKSKIESFFSDPENRSFEQVTFSMIKPDGVTVWLEFSGIPLVNDNNEFLGFRGIGRDVTRSVLIEEKNRQLFDIVEMTPDIVRISDINGDLLYMNKAGKKNLKVSDDVAITSCNSSQFMTPEDWSKILDGRSIAIRDGIWQGNTRLRATDGTVIPVSQVIIAHKTGRGDEMIFSTIARILTETTHSGIDLWKTDNHAGKPVEDTTDPLLTISLDGTIQDVNHAMEIATGRSKGELIGKDVKTFFREVPEKDRGIHNPCLH